MPFDLALLRRRRAVGNFPTASFNFLSGVLDSRITFSRGTNATLTDSTGRITYAPANLLVRSQEFDNAAWTKSNTTVSTGVADPLGGTTACTVTATASSGHILQQVSLPAGINAIPSIWLRRRTGTGAIRMWNAAGGTVDVTSSVTSTWTRIQTPVVACSAGPFLFLQIATSGDAVDVWGAQLEPVTYQTTPSTYVATTSAAYYGPRFDCDPVTLAPRGLLIEEQRTNLVTYSEQFDNAAWTKTNASVTANATTSPDGTSNADAAIPTTTPAVNKFVQQIVTSYASGTTYTHSVYAKAFGYTGLQIVLPSAAFAGPPFANFDLANGVASVTYPYGGSGATATITAVGNGWYRCTVTMTATGTAATAAQLRVMNTYTTTDTTYTANGTSGIYLWGAQLEAGAFATSYIPTVASTVTRNADVATMTGTNFSSWYNQSEGTFVADFSTFGTGANRFAVSVSDGLNSERIVLFAGASNFFRYIVTDGNVGQVDYTLSGFNTNSSNKGAGAYALNSFNAAINGSVSTDDTAGTIPTVDRLFIGLDAVGGSPLNGHIRTLAYFNTRQPNTQLQTLTAPALVPSLSLDFLNNVYNVGF